MNACFSFLNKTFNHVLRNLPDPTGTAAVVSQPGTEGESSGGAGAGPSVTAATCGSGQGYEKNVNMALNEIAMRNGCVPEWTLVSESGPQHQKVGHHYLAGIFSYPLSEIHLAAVPG